MTGNNQDKEIENSKELCDLIESEKENKEKSRREALANLEKNEELYTVATTLTKYEADYIQDILLENSIFSRKEIDGNLGRREFKFRIDVYKGDVETATNILERMEDEKKRNKREALPVCPACKLSEYTRVQELNLFDKFLYAGCKVYKCLNCGKKWGE
jgi:hypothetical protein